MGTFGTTVVPVRNDPDFPININTPDGFMTEPPGDLWWIGMADWWEQLIPPAVTRATAIIVNPLVRMPWIITDGNGRQMTPTDPDYPWWLRDPMLLNGSTGGGGNATRAVSPMPARLGRFDFFARWVRDALQLGSGLLICQLASDGTPLAGSLKRLPAGVLQPTSDGDGWELQLADGPHTVDVDGTFTAGGVWRLVVLRHSVPGGVFGRHRAQLQLANRVTSYADESLNSHVPSGVVTTEQPLTQAQSDQVTTEWERKQERRRVAVLGNGARYQQVVMSPVEAELVAMARLSNEQVAHMFELAAWHLDASTNSMTYANARDNRQDLVDGTLSSWSARIEDTISALLPARQRMHIDFTAYTTQTSTTQGGNTGDPPSDSAA